MSLPLFPCPKFSWHHLNPSSFLNFELNGFPFLSEYFKLSQDLELSFKSLQAKLNQVRPICWPNFIVVFNI